jgi:hypothetical protein
MDYAKMPKMMLARFGGIPMDEPLLTNAQNKKNYVIAVQDWNYGPEIPTNEARRKQGVLCRAGRGDAMRRERREAQALLELRVLRQQPNGSSQDRAHPDGQLRQGRRVPRSLREAEFHLQRYAGLPSVGRPRIRAD